MSGKSAEERRKMLALVASIGEKEGGGLLTVDVKKMEVSASSFFSSGTSVEKALRKHFRSGLIVGNVKELINRDCFVERDCDFIEGSRRVRWDKKRQS